jgi:hypothetical protein
MDPALKATPAPVHRRSALAETSGTKPFHSPMRCVGVATQTGDELSAIRAKQSDVCTCALERSKCCPPAPRSGMTCALSTIWTAALGSTNLESLAALPKTAPPFPAVASFQSALTIRLGGGAMYSTNQVTSSGRPAKKNWPARSHAADGVQDGARQGSGHLNAGIPRTGPG